MNPILHSISTVCLLKHYNQDYLMHSLRTDFTGSNGVGKSIIADLFQIVFVADTRYIKFATEGIDRRMRRIDKLPYESNVGYVFFNVEVKEGAFLTIGAAIFAQGNNLVRPFIVTSTIELEKGKLDSHTFGRDKLLFCNDFLKPTREPLTLDDLARVLPEKSGLYLQYFSSKEERIGYYHWLYNNELLPINLTKEGNLKAYAKVIQSFSKSKALDIDSSKSLVDYLFEEDEIDIAHEYRQQEETISKLLHQFKSTKDQIVDISNKQKDLRLLSDFEEKRRDSELEFDNASYIQACQKYAQKEQVFKTAQEDLQNKQSRLDELQSSFGELSNSVVEAGLIANKRSNLFIELAGKQSLFEKLSRLRRDELELKSIDTASLMHEARFESVAELLEKDARFYMESIEASRAVLKRYDTVRSMERQRDAQNEWLKASRKVIERKYELISQFKETLKGLADNSFFVQVIASGRKLDAVQKAILVHLRNVVLRRPPSANDGVRFVESVNAIEKFEVTEDHINNGWWLRTGFLNEFVPEASLLLPDLPQGVFDRVEDLLQYLNLEAEKLQTQIQVFEDLGNGLSSGIYTVDQFDVDLSDITKIRSHKLAAQLCAVVNHKIEYLQRKQNEEVQEIELAKAHYGVELDGIEYESLLAQLRSIAEAATNTHDALKERLQQVKLEINTLIETVLPVLEEKLDARSRELEESSLRYASERDRYHYNYPGKRLPEANSALVSDNEIERLQQQATLCSGEYINIYNQIVGKYEETKDQRDIRVNEQVRHQSFDFSVLEQALLGKKIRTVDVVTDHLEALNTELLAIADDLLENLTKVFGRTEAYYDKYKESVRDLNGFFRGRLISNRFYFRIDFESAPKLDIKWIEHLRKSAAGITTARISGDVSPEQFIEDFYLHYSGNKTRIPVVELLNPKRYFVLKGRLTDRHDKDVPGSTGESYTAVALLGIARLSIVQDGERSGLRFIILEESATLDNINFNLFPSIAKEYGYQIITMTPKPYAIGDDKGWFVHQLIPGKINEDINYPKTMSYFRTNRHQLELDNYIKSRR